MANRSETIPISTKIKATSIVVNSSRKSSTQRWTTQNRQKSPIANVVCVWVSRPTA